MSKIATYRPLVIVAWAVLSVAILMACFCLVSYQFGPLFSRGRAPTFYTDTKLIALDVAVTAVLTISGLLVSYGAVRVLAFNAGAALIWTPRGVFYRRTFCPTDFGPVVHFQMSQRGKLHLASDTSRTALMLNFVQEDARTVTERLQAHLRG